MTDLLCQLSELDQALLAWPYGEELGALPLLEKRQSLLEAVSGARPSSVEFVQPLAQLLSRSDQLLQKFAHVRRRLASDVGETETHRLYLKTLGDSLETDSENRVHRAF
jgi:hypothetical protein